MECLALFLVVKNVFIFYLEIIWFCIFFDFKLLEGCFRLRLVFLSLSGGLLLSEVGRVLFDLVEA